MRKKVKKKTGGSLQLIWKAIEKFGEDHGFLLSAGIAFNFLLCMIPTLLLLLALIGHYLYSSREILNHVTFYLQNTIPSLDPQITKNIMRIVRHRKVVGILGIGGLIWTSTWIFSSLRTVLNIIFQVEKGRKFLRDKAIDVFLVLSAGVFLLISMALTSLVTFIQGFHFSYLPDIRPIAQFALRYLIPFVFAFWMSLLVYKIIPNRKIHLKSAYQAAIFTSLLWEVAKQLFGWYVLHLHGFSMVYGSLSTLAIFFLLVYYYSAMLILGGEVVFFIEKTKH